MPDDRESAIGRLVQNVIRLERLANTISRESQQQLQELFEAIASDLREIDPTGPPQTTYRRLRTEKLIEAVKERLKKFAPEHERFLKKRLAVVGREQALEAENALIATIGDASAVTHTPVTQHRLRAIMNTEPFRGRLLSEHTKRLSANALVRIRDQVRIGMRNEESIPDIVRRIRGRQAGFIRQDPKTGNFVPKGTPGAVVKPRFTGGALSTSTREAEALVRTAVNFVSNEGMMGTYRANEAIMAGVRFSAALDDRTSTICLSLDGEVWPMDSDEIQRPPMHYGCRSLLVPDPDWDRLGMEPPPEPTRAVRDLSDVSEEDLSRKVSARRRTGDFGSVKQTPSSTLASEWLKDQPQRVQEKMLGVGKARLFREGKISLKDLVRRDNTTVPLSDLTT